MSGSETNTRDASAEFQESTETRHPRSSRFRFKSKRARSASEHGSDRKRHREGSADSSSSRRATTQGRPEEVAEDEHSPHRRHRRHRHHHHRRSHRQDPSRSSHSDTKRDPATTQPSTPYDADTAFRESLFDALADDEGAAYWEGVYGQPIHTYSSTTTGPDGALERMTDDEYVAHVRARMWEKSHEHIVEERARRAQEAQRRKEREKAGAEFHARVEASLRRGEERRREKGWLAAWEGYERAWAQVKGEAGGTTMVQLREAGIWPVKSGRVDDVEREAVEDFFRHAPGVVGRSDGDVEDGLRAILKAERVRWHPDKMQQRYGGGEKADAETMRRVTAVFQWVDALWGTLK